ncbi:MAG: phytase [Novosphingobium sp.]|nr:phytase [Novosphingobium sp.]
MRVPVSISSAVALAGCAMTPPVNSLPAVVVTASGETEPVGTANADAADDPAIWRNPADPAQSLIVATDKKAGLYVYGLDGKRRGFFAAGLVNNVDLVDLGEKGVIVAASDRNDLANAAIQLFQLDTVTGVLTFLGKGTAGAGEGYGFCMAHFGGQLLTYSPLKNGAISEIAIDLETTPAFRLLRTLKVATQPEGCIVDARDGTLFVGEEGRGIWRFVPGATEGELVAMTDGQQLVADVEGLAIWPSGEQGGFLVASSQGDNAYALYRLPDMAPAGRFRIGAGRFGATQETDGIDLVPGNFGSDYPDGLFVAQDGDNRPHAQNFKLVSWRAILEATGNR